MLIELLAVALLGQTSIPAMTVPPTSERSIVFTDRGRIYLVGVESGRVSFFDNAPAPNPIPDDGPIPTPDPSPVQYDFAILVVDAADPAQQPLRTDTSIREAVKSRGAIFRSILSTEEDVGRLGLQQRLTDNGMPYLALLKKTEGGQTSLIVKQIGKATKDQILEAVK